MKNKILPYIHIPLIYPLGIVILSISTILVTILVLFKINFLINDLSSIEQVDIEQSLQNVLDRYDEIEVEVCDEG